MLTAETAILARLKQQIATAKTIASSAAIAGTIDAAALCPAVIVHPGAVRDANNSYEGGWRKEEQEWHVLVLQKLVGDSERRDTTYQEAGALMRQVITSLCGYHIDEKAFHPIKYVGRAEPVVNPGYVEFQINFTVHHKF